jgi:hypothetical protein
MMNDSKEIVDAFEKLSEAGNGVLATPPQDEKERDERDRLMQNYLRQRKSVEVPSRQK